MLKAFSSLFRLSLGTLGYLYATATATSAQVTSDGTVNTQVNQVGSIAEIRGGEIRGSNLFHSFQDFSVSTNNEAFFFNSNDISNIFSRVTGGNISNIDGAIRANGSASLFLINPAGIVFGENARLNVGGSFYGSTADSILFEDGEFSAVDNFQQPVLTINAPIGLSFRDEPGDIVNRSFGQNISERSFSERSNFSAGETLALVGGNIQLDEAFINLDGEQILLGGLAEAGIVGLNSNGSLDFPDDVSLANIVLRENSSLDANASNGGGIALNAQTLEISGNSNLFLETLKLEESDINELGNIEILVDYINIQDSTIQISNSRGGNSGDILINASDNISLDENSTISTLVNFEGNSGNIEILTNSISLLNNSRIRSSGFGEGDTGSIFIQAREGIVLDNSFIFSEVLDGSIGDSGDIVVDTGSLELLNGSQIVTLSFGEGNSGDIKINSLDDISLAGTNSNGFNSLIATATTETGLGNSGSININTNNIFLLDGGGIFSGTFGNGDGGNINIAASNEIRIQGRNSIDFLSEGISTNVSANATGNGGSIDIATTNLNISDEGTIDVSTAGLGDGGNINISTENLTINSRGSINASSLSDGNGGSIFINSGLANLCDNSQINANSNGEGAGGSIFVQATNLNLGNSSISATNSSNLAFLGGDTNLQIAETLFIFNNGFISTEAFGNANAGDVSIDAKFIIGRQNDIQELSTTAEQGQAGNILINAEFVSGLNLPTNANSTIYVDGDNQSENIVESEQTIAQICQTNRLATAKSGFSIEGQGGIIPEPGLPLNSNQIIGAEDDSTSTIPAPIETEQGKIQLARGVKVAEDGTITLTAYRTDNAGQRLPQAEQSCN